MSTQTLPCPSLGQAHLFWFDPADNDPMEGWHICRICGWRGP